MVDKATYFTAKRLKLLPAVGPMPDSSKLGISGRTLLQAQFEARDGCPCFCHAGGHPGAIPASLEPAQPAEEQGKDLAEVVIDEASASSSVSRKLKSSELVGSSRSQLLFDPVSLKGKAATPAPADADASAISVLEASEKLEQPANSILLSPTNEKKEFEGRAFYNPDVAADLQKREPKPFRDQPDQAEWTSGLGSFGFMYLAQQPELTGEEGDREREGEAADHLQLNEPPMGIGGTISGGTISVPTFEAGFANGGGDRVLMPIMEMTQVGIDGFLH